jgi:hypothetical protein
VRELAEELVSHQDMIATNQTQIQGLQTELGERKLRDRANQALIDLIRHGFCQRVLAKAVATTPAGRAHIAKLGVKAKDYLWRDLYREYQREQDRMDLAEQDEKVDMPFHDAISGLVGSGALGTVTLADIGAIIGVLEVRNGVQHVPVASVADRAAAKTTAEATLTALVAAGGLNFPVDSLRRMLSLIT